MTLAAMTARRGVVVSTLGITQTLAWGSTYYLTAVFADPVTAALHLPRAWFFGVFSAALLLSGLLGPLAGRMIDRFGGRDVLAATNLVFAAGLLLLARATDLTGLVAAWAVLGIGMGFGLYEAAFATAAGLYGRDARNAITGITLFAGFASTVGWPTSALFIEHFGPARRRAADVRPHPRPGRAARGVGAVRHSDERVVSGAVRGDRGGTLPGSDGRALGGAELTRFASRLCWCGPMSAMGESGHSGVRGTHAPICWRVHVQVWCPLCWSAASGSSIEPCGYPLIAPGD